MTRSLIKVIFLAVLVSAGWVGLWQFERHHSPEAKLAAKQREVDQEKQKNEELRQVVEHLQAETRVADILVTRQETVNGRLKTELLFQEYARDGSNLAPKRFVINGDKAHIDAEVIKFEGKFVQNRDPLRGRSIALFTRLFDDATAPDNGYVIDDAGHIPAIYRSADANVSAYEQQLWKDFWKLATDKAYRQAMGVDVLEGKSVWWRFEPGYLYTLTLQSDADLTLRYEPLKGIYREMLNHGG